MLISQKQLRLEGFALGNDCPGNRVFTCTPYSGWLGTQVSVDFLFRHGMLSEDYYDEINEKCKDFFPGTYEPPISKACRDILEDPIRPCKSVAGDTYDMGGGYFLYDTCNRDLMALDKAQKCAAVSTRQVNTSRSYLMPPQAKVVSQLYACGQERNRSLAQSTPYRRPYMLEITDFAFSTGLN